MLRGNADWRERDLIFITELNEIYEFQGGGTEQREMEPFLISPQEAGTRFFSTTN